MSTLSCLPDFVLGCAQEVGGGTISFLAPTSELPIPAGEKQRQGVYCGEVKEDVQEPVRRAGLGWRRLAATGAVVRSWED